MSKNNEKKAEENKIVTDATLPLRTSCYDFYGYSTPAQQEMTRVLVNYLSQQKNSALKNLSQNFCFAFWTTKSNFSHLIFCQKFGGVFWPRRKPPISSRYELYKK